MSEQPKLGIIMKFIHNAIETDCNIMLKEMNLTFTQLDILIYLFNNKVHEINQKDIEREFKVKNPTVTGILKRMEDKGLIERIVKQDDGRYKQIVLTDKSREMEQKIHLRGQQIEEKLSAGLSPDEINQLSVLLNKVLKNFS